MLEVASCLSEVWLKDPVWLLICQSLDLAARGLGDKAHPSWSGPRPAVLRISSLNL